MADAQHAAFASRLKALMVEDAMSQGDLARLAGVSTATVWGWLNESLPQRRTVEILCQKLNVSRKWLVTGTGPRQRAPRTGGVIDTDDFMLSLLEHVEDIKTIAERKAVRDQTLRAVAADLRKLADRYEQLAHTNIEFDKQVIKAAQTRLRRLKKSQEK